MPLPASAVIPVVSRDPIAVLQYFCDDQARRRPALVQIFAALRSEITRIGENVGSAKPVWTSRTLGPWATEQNGKFSTPEYIPRTVWFRAIFPTKCGHCKHGLREAWCALCKKREVVHALSEFPETATPIGKPVQYLDEPLFALEPEQECKAWKYALRVMVRQSRVKSKFVEPPKRTNCGGQFVPFVRAEPKSRKEILTGPANDAAELDYGYKLPVAPKFGDALSLSEYAVRHRDSEAATLPHLPNYCDGCQRHVTVLHDAERCAAKTLAGQQAAAERIEMIRKRQKQRRHDALIVQGLYSPEAFDREILLSRGSVTAEAVKQFDRDLSRKGNKYRIQ